jgi:hypothetical protein
MSMAKGKSLGPKLFMRKQEFISEKQRCRGTEFLLSSGPCDPANFEATVCRMNSPWLCFSAPLPLINESFRGVLNRWGPRLWASLSRRHSAWHP